MTLLRAEELYTATDLSDLPFETTTDLEGLEKLVGQERALDAIEFGVNIHRDGYNLFVMGPHGMGKCSTTRQYLQKQAAGKVPPDDWCYVNNFELPQKPIALNLPHGKGKAFRDDVQELIDDLVRVIPAAFESDQYQIQREEIEEGIAEKRERAIQELSDEAESHDVRLVRTPRGFSFQPLKKGVLVTPEEYRSYSAEEKERIEEVVAVLQEKLEYIIREQHQWQREARKQLRDLNRDVATSAVETLIAELKQTYQDVDGIADFLTAMQKDVVEHTEDFLNVAESASGDGGVAAKEEYFGRYTVNLLVDNSEQEGLPVLYEDSPSYDRLVGRVEHIAQMGTLITDFRLIKPGILHLANGGYLILDIIKLLTHPLSWEGLKRALTAHEVCIQSLGQRLSLVSTVSLEPEPIPLNLKVVLLGDRMLFYLLLAYDPEFPELFKVTADFEDEMDRSSENQIGYVRMMAAIVEREKLLPFGRDAVIRVLDHSSRLAQDTEKLSNHLLSVTDLMRESDHWARQANREVVSRADVQQAIDAKIRRSDRIRDKIYEDIRRGTILIDMDGEKLAQVNGLSVINLENFAFAQPCRITATTRLGHGDVVDIEREVELGGAIHSKGVLIVSAFIGERYAKDQPLSLSASLVFEQTYGEVEGDSASVAELCVLLSSLANAPLKQYLAVTGSVNQHGEVQAIGGVNEKIEGFFDVCEQRGLTGNQGVIIPASNVKHLMLRENVVEAVKAKQFHIHAITSIDEAISILTGIEAGERAEDGTYPQGSVNQRVQERLDELSKLRHEFAEAEKEPGEQQSE